MSTRFVPVELGHLNEGRFLEEANEHFELVQAEMVKHLRKHADKAKGAKAKLVLEIEVKCENAEKDEDLFEISAKSKVTLPTAPTSISLAMGGETQDNQLRLFARRSGTTGDTPRQGILATQDGRTIDPETGEEIPDEDAA
ncbi:MAG: hypothetical protein JXQ73_25115 [Phycisphaerae bacterium]|nr:hypothetical protein [Phycisphaerae bacterium]